MLNQKMLERYADILIWGMETSRNNVKQPRNGDIVRLIFTRLSFSLAEVVFKKCTQMGYHVTTQVMPSPKMEKNFYEYSNTAQLEFISPWEETKYNSLNGSIFIYGSEKLTNLKQIEPGKIARNQKTLKKMRDILQKRESNGEYGWSLGIWPTQDMAEHAGMPLNEMFKKVENACYLDIEDPVSKWTSMYQEGKKITSWLNSLDIDTINIVSKSCDLTVKIGDNRQFVSLSGHNIPSYEVWVSPEKDGTEGVYFSDQPTFRNGNYAKDISLKFKNGKVVEAKAGQGEAFLLSQLQMDDGASYLGEFSLTDKRHSRIDTFMANTLYDENTSGNGQGNSHIALGASLPDSYAGDKEWEVAKDLYSFNDSALHWDLVNIQKKTAIAKLKSGQKVVIYENGMFTLNI